MTPEVKKRIEQIRQGIVPEGYKKTESGIIPNEWRVGQVSKCIEEYKFFSNDISHIPVYSSSRKGLVPQSDYYNQREAVETNLGYKVVPQGYVTYRHMSDDDVFHFNINKTGENVLVSSEYPVFTSSDNCDLSFLISVLNNTARFRYFCKMQKLGGTRTRLYLDNLKRYALALPPFDEQKKIAEILATQDKAIELQGRKIEELKRFKKGYLERMFPRKGQKVPEKRFPGFTDDWEQRKAIDIADYSKGNGYSKGDLTDAGTPIILYGRLYTKYQFAISEVDTFAVPRNGAVYSQGNEVIVPASGETAEDIARASAVEKSGVLLGSDLNILRPFDFINPLFLALAISNGEPQKELAKKAQGKSVVHIHNTDIQEVTIAYPSRTEQDRIVSVFRQLDNLITLHQRKLEEMKKQKKALMQLLLTGIVRVRL